MPEERRSTALDPDLLTAEIGLLLDYLSGLPERILTSPQLGHLPPGCATYDEALSRYFPIDEKARRGETLQLITAAGATPRCGIDLSQRGPV